MIALVAIECAALLLLLCGSAFFSSAETAMFSLNPVHIHRIRTRRRDVAERIETMLTAPTQLLSTILIGNTVVNVVAAALGYVVAEQLFPGRGEAVSIPVLTVTLLLFGEVGPKRLAMSRAEQLAAAYTPVLTVLVRVFGPIRAAVEWSGNALRADLLRRQQALTEDEFRTVVEVGEEEGVLDEEERLMVDGIIRLEETQASDVMTPRVDLIGIDLDDPPEEQVRTARQVKFRYLPLYRESLDHPEGFLDVPRFLLNGAGDFATAKLEPYFVPETAPLDSLLTTFQSENRRVAFVVDEFGGTAGLITRGDMLEEIVPDVDNEYEHSEERIQSVGPNRWLVNGSTSIEDVNYELDVDLAAEGADRIAGWVAAQAERIPRTGDVLEAQGCRVTVQRVRKNRILLVMLEKLARPVEAPEDESA